jgi:hypothetical protein
VRDTKKFAKWGRDAAGGANVRQPAIARASKMKKTLCFEGRSPRANDLDRMRYFGDRGPHFF